MNRYVPITLSAFFILIGLFPYQVLAASITETTAAIGKGCVANGNNSTAMGLDTTASATASTAMGYATTASELVSTAMGASTTASGLVSTAMGNATTASGSYSTAMGNYTTASGESSTAMGYYTKVIGDHSTVIGAGFTDSTPTYFINSVSDSFMVGYMADASDTTPEFFVRDGSVGINTTSPFTRLHVKRSISGGAILANHVAAIENTSTGLSADVLMLKVSNTNPGAASNFITFSDSTDLLGSIEGNGIGGIQLNTSGGDFAEYLPKADPNEPLDPGDIVGLRPGGLSRNTQNAQRIMVVTTAPAVLGNRPKNKNVSLYAPVAFLGQVPVKTEGRICSGDYIIPSGRGDGIGMPVSSAEIKPMQYGSIVGRAIETNTEKGMKTVRVLVGLPHKGLWEGLVKEKEARISNLEKRLGTLEAKSGKSTTVGLLPGAGIIMGSLGLFWMDRRRRRS